MLVWVVTYASMLVLGIFMGIAYVMYKYGVTNSELIDPNSMFGLDFLILPLAAFQDPGRLTWFPGISTGSHIYSTVLWYGRL